MFTNRRSRRRLRVYAFALSEQSRRNDPGVVEYQDFVTTEKVRKLRKMGVRKTAAPTVKQQHSGCGAVCQRSLGNLLLWEVVIEIFNAHSELSVPHVQKSRKIPELGAERIRMGNRAVNAKCQEFLDGIAISDR